ncbi:MAG: Energy-coupling factor transporter ATP-binding protein EcfA3 [Dehalococcoidia bacterium]|nr:Energy-coupling factor transporter ATP-binding protein EcfA3 [Bacillota bacterium]MBT9141640.1 Energy-coupling factor transporter ATP-binding protein EcfA3 [Bacillota bacterium]
MTVHILEADNIDFRYIDGTKALKNLSMQIPWGKKIAVVGKNGAGKTTLFLHFNGVNRPEKGRILLKGRALEYGTRSLKELRKTVGIVFQDPDNQLFSASVYQDVSFGPLNLGWPEDRVRAKVAEALEKTGTWALRDKPVHFLSQGQKKRVAIAGVLAMEPEVILLDEPTSSLDPFYSGQIMALLDEFNQGGATVMISSHNIDEVFAWADYVFVMNDGQAIAQGHPQDVLSDEAALMRANLFKPWVLEMYQGMLAAGMIPPQPVVPRTREQIIGLLGQFGKEQTIIGIRVQEVNNYEF